MKTRLRVVLVAFLAAPLLLMGNALAHEGETNTETPSTTTTKKTDIAQNQTTTEQPVAEDSLTLQQRIDKRKSELKTKITALEQKNIQLKCKASQQGSISSLRGRIKGIETSRSQVYDNLVDRLTKLDDKLKANNIDTAEFDAEITELKTKIATFNTDLAAYKQSVSDLAELDCTKDPTAFKASLEAARVAREKVSKDGQAIRSYVKDTIKPTLSKIRQQLEDKKAEGSSE